MELKNAHQQSEKPDGKAVPQADRQDQPPKPVAALACFSLLDPACQDHSQRDQQRQPKKEEEDQPGHQSLFAVIHIRSLPFSLICPYNV